MTIPQQFGLAFLNPVSRSLVEATLHLQDRLVNYEHPNGGVLEETTTVSQTGAEEPYVHKSSYHRILVY